MHCSLDFLYSESYCTFPLKHILTRESDTCCNALKRSCPEFKQPLKVKNKSMIDCLWIRNVADHSVLWRHWIKWMICAFSSQSQAPLLFVSSFIPEYQTLDSIQAFFLTFIQRLCIQLAEVSSVQAMYPGKFDNYNNKRRINIYIWYIYV